MGRIASVTPVKLVVAMLASQLALFTDATSRLMTLFGPVDYVSPLLPFDFTDYYAGEMGPGLLRQFIAFQDLVAPDALPDIKLQTNALEIHLSRDGRRQVNLDPGYLTAGKLVLATTKDQQHRLYLGQGIYGEVTLRYRHGSWQPWEWTYPDYRSAGYQRILKEIRDLYMAQRG